MQTARDEARLTDSTRQILIEFAEGIAEGEEQHHSNLSIIPLYIDSQESAGPRDDTRSLHEELEAGSVEIEELREGARVSEILLRKTSENRTLLLEGEHLEGGMQDRVLNASFLLERKGDFRIPVSCVERGRWRYSGRSFSSGDTHATRSIRLRLARSVSESLRQTSSYESDQGEVWRDVTRTLDITNTLSSTERLTDSLASMEDKIGEYADTFEALPLQVGHAAYINGESVGLELLPTPDLYRKYRTKLLRGIIMECLLSSEIHAQQESRAGRRHELSELLARAQISQAPSPGSGLDVRLKGEDFIGSCLVNERSVEHLVIHWEEVAGPEC